MTKEIDNVLIDGHWRMIQNCRVYQNAQFLNINHRLVVATLKMQLKSRRMVPCQPWLDVSKLKNERVVQKFMNRLIGDLGGLSALGNPEVVWSALKTTILMLPLDVLEFTAERRRILSLKGHWIPLTRVAGPGFSAELSCSGS